LCPINLVEQWGAAFLALYPHAQILVAGKEAFATGNRQKALSRIATGTYDAMIGRTVHLKGSPSPMRPSGAAW
jgi:N12 class adenine-specific DNA methylase